MSFFKVAAPAPTAPKAPHADFTIHSDSENDPPTQPKNETSDSSRNLFSHSSDFLAVQSARIAQEKKRKEREERKKREKSEERRERRVKKEKKDKAKRKSGDEDEEDGRVKKEGDLKKRRITGKEGEALLRKALAGTRVVDLGSSDEEDEPVNGEIIMEREDVLPVRRSPRRPRQGLEQGSPAAKSRRPRRPVPDEDEDDLQITATTSIRRPSPPPEDEDSDPEIAALTRNARAAAAQRKLAAATKPPQDQHTSTPTTFDLPTASSTSTPTEDHADPIISILVSSPMSKGVMMIRRRISQTLGAVREAYCKRWNLPDHCFLTFCGRRLYDSTTCRRFGLVIDAEGNASWGEKDPYHAAGMGKAGAEVEQQQPGQVHVEAMDEAWYKQIRGERERERKERMGEVPEGDDEQETAGQQGKQEEYIKLMVKAKGKRDFRLKVTPTTLFQKIVMASKRSFQLPDDAKVWLEFDGEQLDPKAMVSSTEISDMDCLDLYVGK